MQWGRQTAHKISKMVHQKNKAESSKMRVARNVLPEKNGRRRWSEPPRQGEWSRRRAELVLSPVDAWCVPGTAGLRVAGTE